MISVSIPACSVCLPSSRVPLYFPVSLITLDFGLTWHARENISQICGIHLTFPFGKETQTARLKEKALGNLAGDWTNTVHRLHSKWITLQQLGVSCWCNGWQRVTALWRTAKLCAFNNSRQIWLGVKPKRLSHQGKAFGSIFFCSSFDVKKCHKSAVTAASTLVSSAAPPISFPDWNWNPKNGWKCFLQEGKTDEQDFRNELEGSSSPASSASACGFLSMMQDFRTETIFPLKTSFILKN